MDVSMDCSTLASCSSKHAASGPALAGGLDDGRKATIQDVGPAIYEVPLQWFKDKILPPLPSDFKLQETIQLLKQRKKIKNGAWLKFDKEPSAQRATEDKVFEPFAEIANAVGMAAQKVLRGRKPAVAFKCNPHLVPYSKCRANTSKPDGYGIYLQHSSYRADSPVCWEFIVAPGEKKKQAGVDHINDNVAKILWSFGHLLREDPCRRFVIGYTIENTAMRLWFGSRSEILVSEGFNFIQDHESLVHFFVSQMYATHEQLGFDPTIRPAADPEAKRKNQYDITVHYTDPENPEGPKKSISYRTVADGLLSSIGAEAIKSRGTRVWHAQEIVKGGVKPEKVVIKDYWVDSDRIREAAIRTRILSAARDEKQRELLRRYLLTPLYWGDVMIQGQPDSTFGIIRRATALPSGVELFSTTRSKPPKFVGLIGDMPLGPQGTGIMMTERESTPQASDGNDKCHHRIVFQETAVRIDTLTSVYDIFRIATQTILVLRELHSIGWLHRDISSGNLLLFNNNIKLADLEYAKNMSDVSHHSERSGTACFMAIEVESHSYAFHSHRYESFEPDDEDNDTAASFLETDIPPAAVPQQPISTSKSTENAVSFRQNPLHDIESLWWVLVWLTMTREVDVEGSPQNDVIAQRSFYRRLFKDHHFRRQAFREEVFANGAGRLHPNMQLVAQALAQAQGAIIKAYTEAERNIDRIDHTVADKVCTYLSGLFAKLARSYYQANDIKLRNIEPTKRKTPELPAATVMAYTPSVDAVATKRRRGDDSAGIEVDNTVWGERQGDAKRARKAPSEVDEAVDEVSDTGAEPSGTQGESSTSAEKEVAGAEVQDGM